MHHTATLNPPPRHGHIFPRALAKLRFSPSSCPELIIPLLSSTVPSRLPFFSFVLVHKVGGARPVDIHTYIHIYV